jgi:hypothetical protein
MLKRKNLILDRDWKNWNLWEIPDDVLKSHRGVRNALRKAYAGESIPEMEQDYSDVNDVAPDSIRPAPIAGVRTDWRKWNLWCIPDDVLQSHRAMRNRIFKKKQKLVYQCELCDKPIEGAVGFRDHLVECKKKKRQADIAAGLIKAPRPRVSTGRRGHPSISVECPYCDESMGAQALDEHRAACRKIIPACKIKEIDDRIAETRMSFVRTVNDFCAAKPESRFVKSMNGNPISIYSTKDCHDKTPLTIRLAENGKSMTYRKQLPFPKEVTQMAKLKSNAVQITTKALFDVEQWESICADLMQEYGVIFEKASQVVDNKYKQWGSALDVLRATN